MYYIINRCHYTAWNRLLTELKLLCCNSIFRRKLKDSFIPVIIRSTSTDCVMCHRSYSRQHNINTRNISYSYVQKLTIISHYKPHSTKTLARHKFSLFAEHDDLKDSVKICYKNLKLTKLNQLLWRRPNRYTS